MVCWIVEAMWWPHIDSVDRLESFRALKLSRLESFRVLNSFARLESFKALKLSDFESFRALKLSNLAVEF